MFFSAWVPSQATIGMPAIWVRLFVGRIGHKERDPEKKRIHAGFAQHHASHMGTSFCREPLFWLVSFEGASISMFYVLVLSCVVRCCCSLFFLNGGGVGWGGGLTLETNPLTPWSLVKERTGQSP